MSYVDRIKAERKSKQPSENLLHNRAAHLGHTSSVEQYWQTRTQPVCFYFHKQPHVTDEQFTTLLTNNLATAIPLGQNASTLMFRDGEKAIFYGRVSSSINVRIIH